MKSITIHEFDDDLNTLMRDPITSKQIKIIKVIAVCWIVCGLLTPSGAITEAGRTPYDISYLWHTQRDAVYRYRRQVIKVLGNEIGARLIVVRKKHLHGLIYDRNADRSKARAIARVHAKILRSQGLEACVAVKSRNYAVVDGKKKMRSLAAAVSSGDLEKEVEQLIQRLRAKGLIAPDERTAWSVYDFTSGRKLVNINEDIPLQAASLVKPFFAMAFFHQVRRGKLNYGRKSRRHMRRMIQHSDNASTNWIIKRIGGPYVIDKLLKKNYPRLFKNTRIVEYIPKNGRTYRNKSSAHDYSRFLFALWKGVIPGAREIRRLMALPSNNRVYTKVPAIPKGTRVYNKTGSTARLCGDISILAPRDKKGRLYPYTFIGVIEKSRRARNYSRWITTRANVIRKVSGIVYQGVAGRHHL